MHLICSGSSVVSIQTHRSFLHFFAFSRHWSGGRHIRVRGKLWDSEEEEAHSANWSENGPDQFLNIEFEFAQCALSRSLALDLLHSILLSCFWRSLAPMCLMIYFDVFRQTHKSRALSEETSSEKRQLSVFWRDSSRDKFWIHHGSNMLMARKNYHKCASRRKHEGLKVDVAHAELEVAQVELNVAWMKVDISKNACFSNYFLHNLHSG